MTVLTTTMAGRPERDATAFDWASVVAALSYAFQPIVQLRTGRCHGYEALLRGFERTGFANAGALLDAAESAGELATVENALHAKAVAAYRALSGWTEAKLFLNMDARLVGRPDSPWLSRGPAGPSKTGIVLELSESRPVGDGVALDAAVDRYRQSGAGIAIDDFGVGYSGLRTLYEARPDYVKIDRFFIAGIDGDARKRALVAAFAGHAHALGIQIVAEGIETATEFYTCRDLGCDLAQGFLIARPRLDLMALPGRYPVIEELNRRDRRQPTEAHRRLSEVIERLPPLRVDSRKTDLLDYFRRDGSAPVAPIVDEHDRPLGLIRERDLKRYVYSRFGGELLRNRGLGDRLDDLVIRSPVCDISTPLDRVIEAFSADSAADGIVIVEGGCYAGLLSGGGLLRLVHERNLAMAADQNPLTRLPGNAAILRHIEGALAEPSRGHVLAYLDFDNFKPFNDNFGFRQGDRAILMFSERLKAWTGSAGAAIDAEAFAGHIGGDDFFLGVSGGEEGDVLARLADLLARFRSDAESLYDAETRVSGGFLAKDRYGAMRRFPLLAASGVAVVIPPGSHGLTPDAINAAIADHKAAAKGAEDKLCVVRLG
ncbi:GGDEF domain-containing protein [Azospirillum picis]|uniref:EAL domain-containing protein (Putative c-di-GMP-specific phosphodiesterase class I)/GGDEF domain-containing protein n=1 Tax=Azospirillum picis TaxID=488438 RepID=A0ABU0MPY7_9PROT|nr:GGDEF domain-containing protein [Azospirillum picis]MBP2301700.1 EAL domain-containing protein (putative c-di-GMP-specific phosphodiesterase class I)/GGDEF domain-containing protein [Azospirillum picis]MDQ0535476.1 EAL domain-containing protein (putative c-di-GMP-specific phosphodiesterase class I)/GGDEF domain-containing protein [Azospirillum picis]